MDVDLRVLQRLVDEERIDELLELVSVHDVARAYLEHSHRSDEVGDDDPRGWALDAWYTLTWRRDDALYRRGLLALVDVAEDDDDFGLIGAGVLEDFISDDEATITWVEEQAARSERFRRALGNVWIWELSPATFDRVERAAGVPLAHPERETRAMSSDESRVVSASRGVLAPAAVVFELIADPARQPEWDGNENLGYAEPGQRVRAVGDVFATTLTMGAVRENHVVEFDEGHRIAWMPAEPGGAPIGHRWRWEVEPDGDGRCVVTHTYDWTELQDEQRFERARWTTGERLAASIDRLASLAEHADS